MCREISEINEQMYVPETDTISTTGHVRGKMLLAPHTQNVKKPMIAHRSLTVMLE
jgi:hypothetical protein